MENLGNLEGKKTLFLYVGLLVLVLFCSGCGKTPDAENQNTSSLLAKKPENIVQSEVLKPENDESEVPEPENENWDIPEYQNTAVKVENGNLTGSGVIYQKSEDADFMVVVTAAHVVEQAQEKSVITFFDNLSVETEEAYISSDADLAFLKIEMSSIPKENWDSYSAVCVDKAIFDSMQSGDEVEFADAGKGTIIESWIYVEDFGQYMMLLQGNIQPGMSGGGIYDGAGNFLGILCGAGEKGEVAAVPLSIIQAEFEELY